MLVWAYESKTRSRNPRLARFRADALSRGDLDSIAAAPEALEMTQWQKDELDRRLAEFEAYPNSGATLKEVFARIKRAS